MTGVTQAVFMNQRSFGAPPGQQAYTTPGTYTFVVPTGVTSISVVAVGPGSKSKIGTPGAGGALSYKNNVSVSSGASLTVKVGSGNVCGLACRSCSYLRSAGCVNIVNGQGGTVVAFGTGGHGVKCASATGGGNGGSVTAQSLGGGGGAGGYSGAGGNGASAQCSSGSSGSGGGGGGGGGVSYASFNPCTGAGIVGGGGGGGVGLLGSGSSGGGGSAGGGGGAGSGGSGGSGGSPSPPYGSYVGGNGGAYGGGGGYGSASGAVGGGGAVRIIWPGNTRSFPSTCTGNL